MNNSPRGTQLTNIYGVYLPQIGTALNGNGTVSPSGALDFKLTAKFSPNSGVGMVAGKAVNAVSGAVSGAVGGIGGLLHGKTKPAASSSNGSIPITVTGTTTNPSIRANMMSMFK